MGRHRCIGPVTETSTTFPSCETFIRGCASSWHHRNGPFGKDAARWPRWGRVESGMSAFQGYRLSDTHLNLQLSAGDPPPPRRRRPPRLRRRRRRASSSRRRPGPLRRDYRPVARPSLKSPPPRSGRLEAWATRVDRRQRRRVAGLFGIARTLGLGTQRLGSEGRPQRHGGSHPILRLRTRGQNLGPLLGRCPRWILLDEPRL